jgi:hypothetical protein
MYRRLSILLVVLGSVQACWSSVATAQAVALLGITLNASASNIDDLADRNSWTRLKRQADEIATYRVDIMKTLQSSCDTSHDARFVRFANYVEVAFESDRVKAFVVVSGSSPSIEMVREWARSAITTLSRQAGARGDTAHLDNVDLAMIPERSTPARGRMLQGLKVAQWKLAGQAIQVELAKSIGDGSSGSRISYFVIARVIAT